jgi:DNA anti-recombination protein RmuC
MIEVLKPYLGEAIVAIIGAVVTWFASQSTRKKAEIELKAAMRAKDAELESLRINNTSSIIEQYQKAVKDLDVMYESRHNHLKTDYTNRLEDIKADYDRRYENLLRDNDATIKGMKKELEHLTRQLESWIKKYNALKSEFHNYKKKHEV